MLTELFVWNACVGCSDKGVGSSHHGGLPLLASICDKVIQFSDADSYSLYSYSCGLSEISIKPLILLLDSCGCICPSVAHQVYSMCGDHVQVREARHDVFMPYTY